MNAQELKNTATELVADDKGLLAMEDHYGNDRK